MKATAPEYMPESCMRTEMVLRMIPSSRRSRPEHGRKFALVAEEGCRVAEEGYVQIRTTGRQWIGDLMANAPKDRREIRFPTDRSPLWRRSE